MIQLDGSGWSTSTSTSTFTVKVQNQKRQIQQGSQTFVVKNNGRVPSDRMHCDVIKRPWTITWPPVQITMNRIVTSSISIGWRQIPCTAHMHDNHLISQKKHRMHFSCDASVAITRDGDGSLPPFCCVYVKFCRTSHWYLVNIDSANGLFPGGTKPLLEPILTDCMMTSSNGNIFPVTGPLCVEFTGYRWIPLTKASDAELWCFLSSAPEQNAWVNNRDAGDLRRRCAHYDVTVMAHQRGLLAST